LKKEHNRNLGVLFEAIALGLLIVFLLFLFADTNAIEVNMNNYDRNSNLYLGGFILNLAIVLTILIFTSVYSVRLWKHGPKNTENEIKELGIEVKLRSIVVFSLGLVVFVTFFKSWWGYVLFALKNT